MNNRDIKTILNKYLQVFKEEVNDFPILAQQLSEEESIMTRSNKKGHVTTSGIVFQNNKILLIFHNKLQKYIEPGGHFENDNSLWESAQREVLEETGLNAVLHPWHATNGYIPINIDTHAIPFNEKKNEDEHFHHDFTFVFKIADTNISLQQEEVSDFKWVDINTEFTEKLLINTGKKIVGLGL